MIDEKENKNSHNLFTDFGFSGVLFSGFPSKPFTVLNRSNLTLQPLREACSEKCFGAGNVQLPGQKKRLRS